MTDDTLVIYVYVKNNNVVADDEPVVIRNSSNTRIRSTRTTINGKYQMDCSDFEEGEISLLSSNEKVIQLKIDSNKTPYRVDIISHYIVATDDRVVEI